MRWGLHLDTKAGVLEHHWVKCQVDLPVVEVV